MSAMARSRERERFSRDFAVEYRNPNRTRLAKHVAKWGGSGGLRWSAEY